MDRRHSSCTIAVAAWCVLVAARTPSAQELEPKAYSASPVGAAFLVAGLTRSTGDVVFDPVLPIRDADADIKGVALSGGYTFGLFGKLALVTASVPYAWGDMSGLVSDEARAITRSGLADARVKLSVNVRGNPALRAREFVKAPRRTVVGTSVTVVAPTGQNSSAKFINIGSNRWSFKPEIGVSIPRGRWDVDAYVGVWLFTDNTDAYPGGMTRSQEPVVTVQGHVSYSFKPRLWVAFDATRYQGGGFRVEGGEPTDDMKNSRLGVTLSLPVGRSQSLKFAFSTGAFFRTGTDFQTVSVGWQWLWLTKR